jgi:predicted TIM-barrel fold metal-dependent hydrolase
LALPGFKVIAPSLSARWLDWERAAVLFGSDMPYLEAAMVLGRVLSARISDEDREKILRGNFTRLLEEGDG